MTMKTEVWKAYPDIPAIEVSTLGRVRTRDRMASGKGNGTWLSKGQVLNPFINNNGYLLVNIPINGKWATKLVHRLVAQTFIKNPDNLPEVNHRDCDRINNNAGNLNWCTHQENIAYREKFGKALNRPVFAINLATLEVSQFCSQSEAGRELGVYQSSINNVIKG